MLGVEQKDLSYGVHNFKKREAGIRVKGGRSTAQRTLDALHLRKMDKGCGRRLIARNLGKPLFVSPSAPSVRHANESKLLAAHTPDRGLVFRRDFVCWLADKLLRRRRLCAARLHIRARLARGAAESLAKRAIECRLA